MECLLRPSNPGRTCFVVPSNVANDVTFLLNTSALLTPDDWKCDDMGAWLNNGVQRSRFAHRYGTVEEISQDESTPQNATAYTLVRCYYKNTSSSDVKKFVSYLEGKYSTFVVLWQYSEKCP